MMKNILLILFFISISVRGIAQVGPPPPPPSLTYESDGEDLDVKSTYQDTNTAYTFVEQMPAFIGQGGFNQYLSANIKYPVFEKESGKQGTVYIRFIVEKDGSITDVKEAKGVAGAPGLTREGIRVISAMPKWKPGISNGEPVRVQMTQPIRFVLQDNVAPENEAPAEIKPSFQGGDAALAEYLKQNLVYPSKEKRKHKEGTVVIAFIVEIDGSVSGVEVRSSVADAPGFTKEALRLVNAMQKWNAGTINGRISRMPVEVSVKFKL